MRSSTIISIAAIAVAAVALGAADRDIRLLNATTDEDVVVDFRGALAMTEAKMWESPNGGTLPYRLHAPEKTTPGRLYPMVVLMHGAGERGTNNSDQIRNGGTDFIAWAKRHGQEFVFVAPQCPADKKWVDSPWNAEKSTMRETPTPYLRMAMEIVDEAVKTYPVDPSRIYVIGISMGGYATWELLQRNPGLFAAAIPCCGGGDSSLAPRLVDIPIWVFHGDRDDVVPVVRSRSMVEAIKAAGGTSIKYREYPGMGHDVWTPTFSDDSVFEWLFSQRKDLFSVGRSN